MFLTKGNYQSADNVKNLKFELYGIFLLKKVRKVLFHDTKD